MQPVGEAITSGTTDYGFLSFLTVDDEGCTVRYGIEQTRYRLRSTQANYNALFSMLLACWTNQFRVQLEHQLRLPPLPNRPDDEDEDRPLGILEIRAMPPNLSE